MHGPENCDTQDSSVQRFWMGIVMIFGSLVAGSTSEGGGAIAFPVMTLAFSLPPIIARDFSLMIQSFGMSAALFTIFYMRVKLIQMKAIILTSVAGIFGIAIGMELIAPNLKPPYVKMYFTAIWASFAIALYLMNRNEDRKVYPNIPDLNATDIWHCKIKFFGVFNLNTVVIFVAGIFGGIFTALAGNGMDICLFSVLTLYFRVNEKTATPTSVVLMAINTVVGFVYRLIFHGGVEHQAWRFLAVSVPIVVVGAPFGSYLGSNLSRMVLAWLIYIIDFVQLVGAIVIIKPWNIDGWVLTTTSVIIFIVAVSIFIVLSKFGLEKSNFLEGKTKNKGINNPAF